MGLVSTRRFKVNPPLPNAPMLVVYWCRWVGSNNDVGPWSETVVARVEGHPAQVWRGIGWKNGARPLVDVSNEAEAVARGEYSVRVRDEQYEYLNRRGADPAAALPAPAEGESKLRLQAPPASEAA
jgi:hypothetical protein